jgi:hypothetical protein
VGGLARGAQAGGGEVGFAVASGAVVAAGAVVGTAVGSGVAAGAQAAKIIDKATSAMTKRRKLFMLYLLLLLNSRKWTVHSYSIAPSDKYA